MLAGCCRLQCLLAACLHLRIPSHTCATGQLHGTTTRWTLLPCLSCQIPSVG
ncbi:hypothetical protein NEUTE1DRAFT_106139 [Neurospora tetrasperma FGSC 2508]|uniref:Uncharacterized protein n=1 Tax=Neurospora tetrasperma (strain FGSC 2508 / ATCC MYA-4615 / P0657) TaxID=510951 RepID=F8N1Y1_NEUT8|nr:uncharacterized protein NEUTE1DRAFT_106139 [Neurospora tetrasperma FGSC 2508]EGO53205.1 hypothetical protein NEUTE1DRAFT_106139 [Neurospora tetrasperma FGSC 2508]